MKVGNVGGALPIDRGSEHDKKTNRRSEVNEKKQQQDKVDLSSEAKQKARESSGADSTARTEQVYKRPTSAEAKQMNEDEQKLVESLMSRTGGEDESPEIRREKVEEAREKVKAGDYSDKKVIDKVARRIMEQFGLGNE